MPAAALYRTEVDGRRLAPSQWGWELDCGPELGRKGDVRLEGFAGRGRKFAHANFEPGRGLR